MFHVPFDMDQSSVRPVLDIYDVNTYVTKTYTLHLHKCIHYMNLYILHKCIYYIITYLYNYKTFVYMRPIAGQTAEPNGLNFFGNPGVFRGVTKA